MSMTKHVFVRTWADLNFTQQRLPDVQRTGRVRELRYKHARSVQSPRRLKASRATATPYRSQYKLRQPPTEQVSCSAPEKL